jgi:predicted cupin superfamily sugar epimerase
MKEEISKIVNELSLIPHPEGGYYREIYRSPEIIKEELLPERFSGSRSICTSIYYLLDSKSFSAWHRIKSDETWHLYSGSPLSIHMLCRGIGYEKIILGGVKRQYTISYGTWFAVSVDEPDKFSLAGCTVSPGFDFDDFEMGKLNNLLSEFPEHQALIRKYVR